MPAVFDGLRVVDLTEGFAGALCTMLFGDNGASVVRIVPPSDEERDPAMSLAGARQWHRSKDIRRLDLRTPEALDAIRTLLDEADVAVATAGAWTTEHLGDFAAEVAARPTLIGCYIDSFGDHPRYGNLPMVDGIVNAVSGRGVDLAGLMRKNRPVYVAPPLPSYGAGNAAVQGICAALHDRFRTGRGQMVRTSMIRSITPFDFRGPSPGPMPARAADPVLGPYPMLGYTPARTKDGRWLQWANWAPHLFWNMLDVLGLGEWRTDPVFKALPDVEPAIAHQAWEQILLRTGERTAAEWVELLTSSGVTGGDLFTNTIDGMDHPQARHNGNVVSIDGTEQIGPVARMGVTATEPGPRPWATARTPVNGRGDTTVKRPLDGIVLLEAASMIATPIGSCLLSDLGARVIKIEPLEGEPGRVLPFKKTLLGKESICVDVKTREGLAIVHQLAARADMFLHNYRPGVPEKLGIDYASLSRENKGLIYVYAGAYGKDGPYSKMPAYHPIAGGICGNAVRQAGRGALISGPADLATLKAASLHLGGANEGHPDPVTGVLVASVLLMGLYARDRLGVGQEMTATMLGASAYLMSADWIRYDGRPPIDEVDADILGTHALNRLYPASEGWVFLGCSTQGEWERAAAHLGRADLLSDDRFKTPERRRANDAALAATLADTIASRRADDIEDAAVAAGVGCVRADRSGFGEYQLREIAAGRVGMAREVESPGDGRHWRAAATVEMRGVDEVGGACAAGQHTGLVLGELGYTDAQIADLAARDVVRLG